jgi:hypothetical protein
VEVTLPFTLTLSDATCPNAEQEATLIKSLEETITSTISKGLESNARVVKTTVTINCLQRRKLRSTLMPRNLAAGILVNAVTKLETLCVGDCDAEDMTSATNISADAASSITVAANTGELAKEMKETAAKKGLNILDSVKEDTPIITSVQV